MAVKKKTSAKRPGKIGIIGGSGLYNIEGFTNQKWVKVKTPFGEASDSFLTGKLSGREVVFLPRHGRGHKLLPNEIPHRANIWGMKSGLDHQRQRRWLAPAQIQTL